ncbi:hypothetical protein ACFWXK_10885 [Streptomyces sp. NPDC059070]|uniref:hypothetical protein n=1 Tax=Streptomyces sp. NPDC059070 TaxID=3346713 RepID=UPI0036866C32
MSEMTQDAVLTALHRLVGSPLRDVGRASDLAWFSFGEPRHVAGPDGSTRIVHEHALHLQCPFRLSDNTAVLMGSQDVYYPADRPSSSDDPFDWDRQDANLLDHRIEEVRARIERDNPVVEHAQADPFGGFRLAMSGGLNLQVLPVTSFRREHWRYLRPYTDEEHFVVFESDY